MARQWSLHAEVVTKIDLVCSMQNRPKVLDWIYGKEGRVVTSGPYVRDLRVDTSKFHVTAYVPGAWKQELLEIELLKLKAI